MSINDDAIMIDDNIAVESFRIFCPSYANAYKNYIKREIIIIKKYIKTKFIYF